MRVALLNEVRMALRIITASDIVAINETSAILPNILECRNYRSSNLDWPRCETIDPNWIKIWKSALIELIAPIVEENPLGKIVSTTHQKWTAYLSENSMHLQYNNRVYKKHTSTRRPQYRLCTASNVTCFQPADIYELNNGNLQVIGKGYLSTPEAIIEPQGLMEFFNRASDRQRRIWGTGNINEETLNVLVLHPRF